ncbi:MAG: UDP-N-acetylglucosamine 1-carboxyvinyltransferase, partial [Deltaproteobacteria bacterium]|nr:UDP-N-acetylglucosamine 1-carboxyvinyltransferase [Deltaproteobacteria bacterium]
MDKILIEGGNRLVGEVRVSGAKNAVLPLMAASLLVDGVLEVTNVPRLRDIETFKTLLEHLGSEVAADYKNGSVRIKNGYPESAEAPYEMVKTMRAAVLVLGPLVSRFKKARVSLPGGCAIGARPINLHLKGLRALGAEVRVEHGYVEVKAERLKGARIYFDVPTVTGTENMMLAAVFAEG